MIDTGSNEFRTQVIRYLIDEYGLSNSESKRTAFAETIDEILNNLETTLYERKRTENIEGKARCWISGKPLIENAVHITIPMQRLYPDENEPKQGKIETFSFHANKEALEKTINKELGNLGLSYSE